MNHLDVVMLTTATQSVKFVVQKRYKGMCAISSSNPHCRQKKTAKFPTYFKEIGTCAQN